MSVNPHNVEQKGSKGEIHDGRPDRDHEKEVRKAGGEKDSAREGGEDREPKEVKGE